MVCGFIIGLIILSYVAFNLTAERDYVEWRLHVQEQYTLYLMDKYNLSEYMNPYYQVDGFWDTRYGKKVLDERIIDGKDKFERGQDKYCDYLLKC